MAARWLAQSEVGACNQYIGGAADDGLHNYLQLRALGDTWAGWTHGSVKTGSLMRYVPTGLLQTEDSSRKVNVSARSRMTTNDAQYRVQSTIPMYQI